MNRKQELIQIANEKFGELKDGDLLMFDWFQFGEDNFKSIVPITDAELGWRYYANHDMLHLGNTVIYRKGAWCERIEKPKNVKASYGAIYQKEGESVLHMQFNLNTVLPINYKGLSELIIAKIEELNK